MAGGVVGHRDGDAGADGAVRALVLVEGGAGRGDRDVERAGVEAGGEAGADGRDRGGVDGVGVDGEPPADVTGGVEDREVGEEDEGELEAEEGEGEHDREVEG